MKYPAVISAILILLASCQTSPNNNARPVIDKTSLAKVPMMLVFENIDPSFWPVAGAKGSMFVDVFLYNQGRFVDSSTVKSFALADPLGSTWVVKPTVTPRYVGGWLRLRSTEYSQNSSVLSLGGYGIAIQDASGKIFGKGIDPARLLVGDDTKKFMYSSKYEGKLDEQYLPALSTAQISSASIEGNNLKVSFNVTDARVLSCAVSVYDKEKKFLGDTQDLVNLFSKEPYLGLNKGTGILTDGSPNALVLGGGDIRFLAGKTLADVKQIEVVCFSGQRPDEVLPARDSVLLLSRSAVVAVSEP